MPKRKQTQPAVQLPADIAQRIIAYTTLVRQVDRVLDEWYLFAEDGTRSIRQVQKVMERLEEAFGQVYDLQQKA